MEENHKDLIASHEKLLKENQDLNSKMSNYHVIILKRYKTIKIKKPKMTLNPKWETFRMKITHWPSLRLRMSTLNNKLQVKDIYRITNINDIKYSTRDRIIRIKILKSLTLAKSLAHRAKFFRIFWTIEL